MKPEKRKDNLRCAIYTRVSTENGLEQEFNSFDNQREASEAYIRSQAHEGWRLLRERYDDGGFSGGSIDRPALKKLRDDVGAANPAIAGTPRSRRGDPGSKSQPWTDPILAKQRSTIPARRPARAPSSRTKYCATPSSG
jgi:Resolvase, N terminal domain